MKRILIKDSMTEISADVYRVSEASEGLGQAIGHRAGFGDALAQHFYVILVRLSGGVEAQTDPFHWSDGTMRAAHLWLREHFDEVPHGGAIDVEELRLAMAVPA